MEGASSVLGERSFVMTRWFLPLFLALLAGLEVDGEAFDPPRDLLLGGGRIDID